MPVPGLLAEYERILPGAADRMMSMAEEAQRAAIDVDLVPIRAEAWALRVATVAVAFFPWVAILGGVALLVAGYDTAGYLAGLVGILSAGPQIIAATRRPRSTLKKSPPKPSDAKSEAAK